MDVIKYAGKRTVGNMMEQGFPFIVTLWLHAVFINPFNAAVSVRRITITCRL
jgi:hypothetical protein